MNLADQTFVRATITWRANSSDDYWSIRLDPGAPFTFKAGQYATLGFASAQQLIERPYSIVSSPHEEQLEFFIELVREGELTPLLHRLSVGHTLTLRKGAKGRFLFDVISGRKNHLLLCTSIGIAPYVSYIRSLLKNWNEGQFPGNHRLFLIQGASRSCQFGYHDEMERIARQVPWLTYVPTVSRPWEEADWSGETGRVDDILRKYTDLWSLDGSHTTAYLCGHPAMIERGKEILHRRGWPKEALKEEAFQRRRLHAA